MLHHAPSFYDEIFFIKIDGINGVSCKFGVMQDRYKQKIKLN